MTHPLVQHARAAAHAVRAARGRLAALTALEARTATAGPLAAAPLLRSAVMGTRHALGAHSDPTSAVLTAPDEHETSWRELLDRLDRKVGWLADQIHPRATGDPLDRITAAIPRLHPTAAALTADHLRDEDAWVREAVGLPAARRPLPGTACPACARRALNVLDAGPVDAWVVVCDCRCAGDGCRCGMTVRAAGVQHIWPRAQVIGAAAGAAPTRDA